MAMLKNKVAPARPKRIVPTGVYQAEVLEVGTTGDWINATLRVKKARVIGHVGGDFEALDERMENEVRIGWKVGGENVSLDDEKLNQANFAKFSEVIGVDPSEEGPEAYKGKKLTLVLRRVEFLRESQVRSFNDPAYGHFYPLSHTVRVGPGGDWTPAASDDGDGKPPF